MLWVGLLSVVLALVLAAFGFRRIIEDEKRRDDDEVV